MLQRAPKRVQAATTMRTPRRLSASAEGPVRPELPVVHQTAPNQLVNAPLCPKGPLRRHIHGYRSESVDAFGVAVLTDLAVLVSGQCLDDKVARIPRNHGTTEGVVMAGLRRVP